eukprot:s3286_g4.t1
MLTTLNRAIDKLVSEATALEALAAEHADGTESERSTESRLNCATKLDSPDLRTSVLHHEGLADEALPQGTGVHLCRGSMAEGGASPDGPHGQCGAAGCDEVEYTFAEAAWRRAVLRLMVLMANAAQRVVMKFMGVRHPREQLQVQLLEVIRGLDDEGLTTARQMLEDAGRARNNDPGSEEWSMVDEMEVAEPVEPRKRRVSETEEQYPNYPGLGPPRSAKTLCYCNLEVETIRTKKLGPNVHRLFV